MGLVRERVIISRKAQESIKDIFNYIKKEHSLAEARNVKSVIILKCRSLKEFAGYSNEIYLKELDGDFKSVTIWSYVIIYCLTEKEVIPI